MQARVASCFHYLVSSGRPIRTSYVDSSQADKPITRGQAREAEDNSRSFKKMMNNPV